MLNTAVQQEMYNSLAYDAVKQACARIAPIWPLDKSIAVNPWWPLRDTPIEKVSAKLHMLGNVKLLMPKDFYQNVWKKEIQPSHLHAAATSLNVPYHEDTLVAYLAEEDDSPHWLHLGDLLDMQLCHQHKMPWRDEIIQQISQFAALYFQYPQRMHHQTDAQNSFYKNWLEVVKQDKGIEILMASKGLNQQFTALPLTVEALFDEAFTTLFGDTATPEQLADYCHALLLDINGWASWMAHAAWQDGFEQKQNYLLEQLLAVRLAWDLVLWNHHRAAAENMFQSLQQKFRQQIIDIGKSQTHLENSQHYAWIWQLAYEYSYQSSLNNLLYSQLKTKNAYSNPSHGTYLQAVFCIDVRSEPIRRALEAQDDSIQTLGFAGFFGLPIELTFKDTAFTRPQLPGLLKSSIQVTQTPTENAKSKTAIYNHSTWQQNSDAAPSTFGLVEAKGIFKFVSLLKNSVFPSKPTHAINQFVNHTEWQLLKNNQPLDDKELAAMLNGLLQAMGLKNKVAERVLLIGHGSSTTNNPHAAGLDCGACGGQSGEVNVRVLAQLLNNNNIRSLLHAEHGIHIPTNTQFIPCLHNTTTDEIHCLDTANSANEPWQTWLINATAQAQQARAASVGVTSTHPHLQAKAFQQRASDWAQLRPEWGLANNAAFIVAPRQLTHAISLEGRSFLHDYSWKDDTTFGVLELIMTAPMIVTHWINLHYYAAVTDNQKYGSGNKLLHNVVGGHIGVFEGNGGDLRIGLPLQSVHDGNTWRHSPLRLSVYIAAPQTAISAIISKHTMLSDLLANQWLHLFQIDSESQQISRYQNYAWHLEKEIPTDA